MNIDNINDKTSVMMDNLYQTKIYCYVYKTLNYTASRFFMRRAKYLNLSIILFSSTAGSVTLSNNIPYTNVIVASFAFMASFLSVIKTFLNYEEKNQAHNEKYQEFNKIIADIDNTLCISTREVTVEEFKKIKALYHVAVEKNPVFDYDFIEKFKKENKNFIEEGSEHNLLPDIILDFNHFINSSSYTFFQDHKINAFSDQLNIENNKKKDINKVNEKSSLLLNNDEKYNSISTV